MWKGLGYEVACECNCHNEKVKASVEEYQPSTNALDAKPLSLEVSKENDH
jgi:hypothetical protein